jgi:hypothetical protein
MAEFVPKNLALGVAQRSHVAQRCGSALSKAHSFFPLHPVGNGRIVFLGHTGVKALMRHPFAADASSWVTKIGEVIMFLLPGVDVKSTAAAASSHKYLVA